MTTVILCKPELTASLAEELATNSPRVIAPGRVDCDLREPGVLAFARQVIPAVETISGNSINSIARAVVEQLAALDANSPWRLHAFALDGNSGRARLVAEAIDAELRAHHRVLRRARNPEDEGAWQPDETLVQLAFEDRQRALLSIAPSELRHALRLSTFAGGICDVPSDKRPPSRAYRKLLEAERRMHRPIAPDETVVDLGASPGGWSFVALERGARVTAIDRAPLRDDLMKHKRLTFVKADAFAWHPPARVDWLLCDLIAFPGRTLALLEDWLANARCRRFVVTMKFRGTADFARLDALKKLLRERTREFLLTSLDANKNEVTSMGEVG